MKKPLAFSTLMLATTQFVAPAALAQVAGGTNAQTTTPPPASTTVDPAAGQDRTTTDQSVEISTPGGESQVGPDIVVIGNNIPNTVRATPQVLSVLTPEDIARTGEGDIAGALSRVTGLSVVGNGFVFVRGLGDRYSSALLNGSPLPSPEPLRRSVPLDIFPTTIIGSALVQKSYSVNYPGEFGGGVINLTTRAVPKDSFFQLGGSVAFDTFSTNSFGYVYDGGRHDWIGYDSGERRVPAFITNAPNGNGTIPTAQVAQLSGAQTELLQQNTHLPANFSGETSFAHSIDIGSVRLGIIGSGSISNSFRTRDDTQQDTATETGTLRSDFHTVITDNRALVNALLGLGAEFGDNRIRITNVYIHDTLKQARGSAATLYPNSSGNPRFQQSTEWFERQLIETQGVGEFKFGDLSLDVRGAYANSKRLSPYERSFDYLLNPVTGGYQATNAFGPFATVTFSRLNENLWSGQADASYKLSTDEPITLSAGYYYSDTDRTSTRLPFVYQTNTRSSIPSPYNYLRPDFLLGADVLNGACASIDDGNGPGCVRLQFQNNGAVGAYAYEAKLRVHAGYVQLQAGADNGLKSELGVRYEHGDESVLPVGATTTRLRNGYFLPAATVTWEFKRNMQVRINASKTIARPQFRELAPQQFQDFESDRLFFGNPNLRDSKLYNAEARYEWFFGRNERFTLAGFYKRITDPIEQVGAFPTPESRLQTGFSYVPSARLYGAEVEVQKFLPLDFLHGDFFANRRIVAIANYTYTQSKIRADSTLVPDISSGPSQISFKPANSLFRDGAPLTGQSDHLVNAQLGIEDTKSTSALTLLFNYASDRVTARAPSNLGGTGFLPDIVERPGIRLDMVARQGVKFGGAQFELKLEGRNLTGTSYRESQKFDDGNIVYINKYKLGRIFSIGLSTTL